MYALISGLCQEGLHEPPLEPLTPTRCRNVITVSQDERGAANGWEPCECGCHVAAVNAKLTQQAERMELERFRAEHGLRALTWDNTLDALFRQ